MKGRLGQPTRTMDGEIILPFITRDKAALEAYDELKEEDVVIEPRRFRVKRSLDANAYAWALMDRLAAQRGISKVEVYREAIRDIGGVSDTVCVRQSGAKQLVEGWKHNGLGWFADTLPSRIDGCVNVVLYYGSSTYDAKQMHDLIDHIVQDCKAVGIETLPPRELEALEQAYSRRKEAT